ncbi:RNA-binding protein 4B-like isoform X2 [Montipora capricornis]|uniref:RNA-binding protein 4B-like isoform X2 n=1 Tax=Montipora foliosa TaxID=591990 RepID=UPI0035F1FDE3
MASEDDNKDSLAEVNNQNDNNTETTDPAASSDAKGESSEDKSTTAVDNDEGEKEVKLYVGNLPDQCRRAALQELFDKFGKVSQCDIVKNFAFVHMVGEKNAKEALENLDDSEFCGTHIQVQYAKTKGKPSEDECFSCGKHGHWAKDCPKRRRFDDRRDYRRNDYGPPRRGPYDRPPPNYYDPYMDRRGGYPPARDYYGYQYRSRSPGRSPPRYTGFYEGYPRHDGYGSRRY